MARDRWTLDLGIGIPRTVESALVVGAHTNLGVEGGLSIALIRVPGMIVTARGDAGWSENRNVVPMFADELLVIGHITTIQPSLIAALAISPQFACRQVRLTRGGDSISTLSMTCIR